MAIALVGVLSLALAAGEQEAERAPAKAGQLIRFEVLIADLAEAVEAPSAEKVLELEKTGKLQARVRFQLASLDELPASIQFTERVSRVSGYRFARPGAGAAPVYQDVNVGTNLRVTARVSEDRTIVAQFYLERTGLAGEAEPPADPNAAIAPPAVDRMQSNTTLRLKAGEPQVIGGQQTGVAKEVNRTWIVITAHVGN
jgi:hypothetical protein